METTYCVSITMSLTDIYSCISYTIPEIFWGFPSNGNTLEWACLIAHSGISIQNSGMIGGGGVNKCIEFQLLMRQGSHSKKGVSSGATAQEKLNSGEKSLTLAFPLELAESKCHSF